MQSKTYIPSPFAANSLAQSECRGGDPAQIFFFVFGCIRIWILPGSQFERQ